MSDPSAASGSRPQGVRTHPPASLVGLPCPVAETLVARAIREEKNIGTLVTEILEAAATKGRP